MLLKTNLILIEIELIYSVVLGSCVQQTDSGINIPCCSVTKVTSNFLQQHGRQHTSLPCPSLSPGVSSNSCPLSFSQSCMYIWFPCELSWYICLQCRSLGFCPWVGKILWRRERLPTPVFWPGEFRGLQSPGGHRVGHDWVTFTFLCAYTYVLYFSDSFPIRGYYEILSLVSWTIQ